jgi:hypothetical protein
MSESGMRGNVIKNLKELDAVAIENPVYPGTPDVNYVDGWIELKWLRRWPVKVESVVQLDHYSPQQRLWIRRRSLARGRCFLLLQCKKEWLLFKHPETMEVGKLTKSQLIEKSVRYWTQGMTKQMVQELKEVLNGTH